MSEDQQIDQSSSGDKSPSRVEQFIHAVERKTKDEVQLRLLRACKGNDPAKSMEDELKRIVEEVLP